MVQEQYLSAIIIIVRSKGLLAKLLLLNDALLFRILTSAGINVETKSPCNGTNDLDHNAQQVRIR